MARLNPDDRRSCVLFVDDDADMRGMVSDILRPDGYSVVTAASGREMWRALAKNDVQILLLDLKLSGGEDGLDLVREIRPRSTMPIVIVSGQDDVIDRVVCLEVGADDFVTKPFHPRELRARMSAVLRRCAPVLVPAAPNGPDGRIGARSTALRFLGWELCLISQRLLDPDGRVVALTGFEYAVLEMLVSRPGQVYSRQHLLERVAGRPWDPDDRSIDVAIGKIRRKFRDDPYTPNFIKTVRSGGYVFVGEVAPRYAESA